MKRSTLLQIALGIGVAAVSTPMSYADLLLYYSFDSDAALSNGSTILNLAPGATQHGTFNIGTGVGNSFSFVPSGVANGGWALSLTPGGDGFRNLEPAFIDTGFLVSALGITPSTAYTAMAWVKFELKADLTATRDNMIFGQVRDGNFPSLHLGSRGTQYHSGHWSDDISGGATAPGEWHHVAYTNDGTGRQEIFVNGISVAANGAGTGGQFPGTENLVIGTSSPAGAAFRGQLDEIKVYDSVLSAAEIQAASAVPEPSACIALAGGGALLLGMRRRRRG